MDGALIATVVTSSLAVAGAIGGGFWKISACLGKQNKSIGRLEGKMDGVDARIEGFDDRMGRLDRRLNGFVDSLGKRTRRKRE